MHSLPAIRRVVLVVLDGLRPDAITAFELPHIQRLARLGAVTTKARTVSPSVTAAAMTSLLTGVGPALHGVQSDRFHIPRSSITVSPLPRTLATAGFPSSAYLARISSVWRGIAARISRQVGIGEVHFVGETAPEILLAARNALRTQRRGMILFHWPDADRAGHEHGWMSPEYAAAARRMDAALGMLATFTETPHDPSTLLIAMADHGGGGVKSNDHESDHPLDRTIPVLLAGGGVVPGELAGDTTLLDVPATVLWALGVARPASYEGRPLVEAFQTSATAAAVA